MASPIDIVNLALSHLGEVPNVSSISPPDGGAHAEKAAKFYPIARDKCLEAHNWSFAVKRVQPAELASPAHPWLHAYSLPADLIRPIAVRPSAFAATNPALLPQTLRYSAMAEFEDDELMQVDYIIENGVIYTDAEGATLRYLYRNTDTTKWTPSFVDAVSWLLASYLAGAITEDVQVKNWAYEMYMQEMQNAQRIDAASIRRTNRVHRPTWIKDR